MNMFIPKVHKSIGKVCALVAATLVIPVLAYADVNNNNNNNGGPGQNAVPDGGPGIVLMITALGAVLVFAGIQRSRAKS